MQIGLCISHERTVVDNASHGGPGRGSPRVFALSSVLMLIMLGITIGAIRLRSRRLSDENIVEAFILLRGLRPFAS